MRIYQVTWKYTAEADTPLEAALEAERCMKGQLANDGVRGVFEVREIPEEGPIQIDLSNEEDECRENDH